MSTSLALAPLALFGLLVGWTAWDLQLVVEPRASGTFAIFLGLAVFAEALGLAYRNGAFRAGGLVLVGAVYILAHLFFLRFTVGAALAFVTLGVAYVSLRQIADRFTPLLSRPLPPETGLHIRGALMRSLARLAIVASVAFFASLLAADLSGAGTVPTTTIPTALFLAVAFVAVLLLLALLPVLERRPA